MAKKEELNDNQKAAVYIRGANTLVSAGAGSGKTFVLTKRVVSLICDRKNPLDIDKLFIATFTVAATSEMKDRIRKALNSELDKINPISDQQLYRHLKKQMALLNRASITTIDSFCTTVVKQNFQKLTFEYDGDFLSVDPSFKICDGWEKTQIENDAMDEFLEKKYGEKDQGFMELCGNLCPNFSDENLRSVMLSILKGVENLSNREKWFEHIIQMYKSIMETDDFYNTEFAQAYRNLFKENVNDINEYLEDIIKEAEESEEEINALEEQYAAEYKAAHPSSRKKKAFKDSIHLSDMIIELKKFKTNFNESFNDTQCENFCKMNLENSMGKFNTNCSIKHTESDFENKAIDLACSVKKHYKIFSDNILSIFKKSFTGLSDEDFIVLRKQAPLIITLINCVREYSSILMRKKLEQQKYTFNDIARFCHDILVDSQGNKTPVAERYAENYAEVIVDEYQDISFLQDDILQAISNGHNLFMVGDIKQAIYRFREANPDIFNEKYKKYETYTGDVKEGVSGYKISLFENYRSRKQVLEASNHFFNHIMSEAVGEVNYDESTKLLTGAKFDQPESTEYNTEVRMIYTPSRVSKMIKYSFGEKNISCSKDEYYEKFPTGSDSLVLEASEIAHRIKELVGNMDITDKDSPDKKRKLTYGDICILIQRVVVKDEAGKGRRMRDYLVKAGIPVSLKTESSLMDTYEVNLLMDYLRVLDNPMQDIPLMSLLYGTVYNFSADEIVEIKKSQYSANLYTAMLKYADGENGNAELRAKVQEVISDIEKFRNMALEEKMYDLISEIYLQTNLYNFVCLLIQGKSRATNLDKFKEIALDYDAKNCIGIEGFLDFAENVTMYEEDNISAENNDSVKITTIHKSKGLEYPVVFVANLGSKYLVDNKKEKVKTAFVDNNILALDYIDHLQMQSYTAVSEIIGKTRKKYLEISEVMRLFYVACTRAKEKLILVGCVPKHKELEENKQLYTNKKGKFIPTLIRNTDTIIGWLDYIMAYCNEKYIDRYDVFIPDMDYIINEETVPKTEPNSVIENLSDYDVEDNQKYRDLEEKLDWIYPNHFASKIPTNMSITEIKRRHTAEIVNDGNAEKIASSFKEQNALYPMPKFIREKTSDISAAEVGSLYHLILEKLDFFATENIEDIKRSVDTFVEKGLLTRMEANALDLEKILAFLNSPLGKRIKKLPKEDIHKETTFMMYMTPDSVAQVNDMSPKEFWGEDYVTVQNRILVNGIIDLYFKEGEKYVLVDYKTDNVQNMEELAERYTIQLKFYKRALEMNYNIKISEMIIYSLRLNAEIIL